MNVMKVKDLISFLENFDGDAEVEIEIYDAVSGDNFDSTFDVGIREETSHPVLSISVER